MKRIDDLGLRKLHKDVCFGHSKGKIIWQPRIGCWYTDKMFAGTPLPGSYEGMSLPEIYRSLGCSDRLYSWYNCCYRRVEPSSVQRTVEKINETDTRTTIKTPAGNQTRVDRSTPNSPQLIHLKWPVESEHTAWCRPLPAVSRRAGSGRAAMRHLP